MAQTHNTRDDGDIVSQWYLGSSFHLFLALVGIGTIHPILVNFIPSSATRALFDGLILASILLGIRAVTNRRGIFAAVFILAAVSGAARWTVLPEKYRIWIVVLWLALLASAAAFLLSDVLRSEKVTTEKLFSAISVYFLMGLIWGLAFIILDRLVVGAFTFPEPVPEDVAPHLIQFSFTTLTTLGFGDISPSSIVARALANFEAVMAQLYLVIIVARLVALHVEQSRTQ